MSEPRVVVECGPHRDVVDITFMNEHGNIGVGLLLNILFHPSETIALFRFIFGHRQPWCEQVVKVTTVHLP